jgi:hypothetical protein
MSLTLQRILAGVVAAIALGGAAEASAQASPAQTAVTNQGAPATRQTAHASLRIDAGLKKAWVGQAIPVTLTAYFRGVEGVTLEGTPQITSPGIFTSDFAPEPRQATELIGGEPALVATWTGTVTPSSPGPLPLSAELPVRVRYRDAAPHVEMLDPFQDDPFAALSRNPFDTSVFDRFFQHALPESLGRLHQEATTLRASSLAIDVEPLPTANQPESFTGAIGRFDLKASLSSNHAHVSEPVTLRVVVQGVGGLDRVDLTGVSSSDAWKAYPPKVSMEAPVKGARPHKVFEQILVPLRNGELSVPKVSLTSFDPDSSKYVTRETLPLTLTVDGTPVTADIAAPAASTPPPSPDATLPTPSVAPLVVPRLAKPKDVALWVAPAAMLIATAAWLSRARRKRTERALRAAMKRAAVHGDIVPFYSSAHTLINAHLSKRWGVPEEEVTASVIRERLGDAGEPLAEAILGDEALRFGKGRLDSADLEPLCSSVERSLEGAS